ncbi:hypothetical protein AKJ52_02575 [candidate division MSBL1 archaeon SCGC-AAA382C18]|uniref:Potassium-transporting ATPase KdpC subunit n=1 Tax=candidate division MSBL1 archaeon SCGC-AAA382C18 TaxID=1698281 RepID=A0A133VI35_9EURY|nr:hypothetical protein AKJ52_02575 [candidate division MSBL1 archaeon SCGC-AAA382C18]
MKEKLKNLSISVRLLIIAIVIFTIAYSGIIGIIGQTLWNSEAEGSLIKENGQVVGSQLIGQEFNDAKFFHSRPSSIDYNAMKSGSQNLSPRNPILTQRVENILQKISKNRKAENLKVPSTLVTESGSALDPHITVRSALIQIPRISKNTGIPENELDSLVVKYSKDKILGIFGMKRVNVLKLNIELDNRLEGKNID